MTLSGPISIVIPAFNCENTIVDTIDSILDGNLEAGDEIVVVDDGLSDSARGVLARLAAREPRIRLLRNHDNLGAPAARNRGTEAARHELVFNFDADNLLVPHSLPRLKRFFVEMGADLATFGEVHFFRNNRRDVSHKWIFTSGPISLADYLAGWYSPGASGTFLYSKSVWRNVGGYDESGPGLHDTWAFSLKQVAAGARVMTLPGTYYLHRYGHESLYVRETTRDPEANVRVATYIMRSYLHLLEHEDREYLTSAAGSSEWFDKLPQRPLRVKGEPPGRTGRCVVTRPFHRRLINRVRRMWTER